MKLSVAFAALALCAAAAPLSAAEIPFPGQPETKPALAPDPFPDRISAYVWRNWFVVPHDRLAKVVGATERDLREIAVEMGLPPEPVVLPEWRRKGYITVLRRNWHLLPYSQLMELLDMDREELRYSLLEDDFLFHKLGRIKPKCDALTYDRSSAAKTAPQRKRIAQLLREEGVDASAPEEPRFKFVKDFAAASGKPFAASSADSPFDFRLISSYFADYGDPLADPEIGSFPEGLLEQLGRQGVNAVWLHTVLRTLAKDPKYPEFGEGCEKRLANLQKLVDRCAKYGIKVYLYVNEPRAPDASFFEVNDERRSFRGTPNADSSGTYAMCTSVPEVRRWVHDSLKSVFSTVHGLGGIFTINMSENLTNCASRWRKHLCPRCKDRAKWEIVGEITNTIVDGVLDGDPEANVIVWDWAWHDLEPEGLDKITAMLKGKRCRLMSVSENRMPYNRGGVTGLEFDYAISIVGPGESAKRVWDAAKANGLGGVAKVQANCSWELSSFPSLPVMDLVARHACNLAREGVSGIMLAWSVGSCPAANLRIFGELRKGETDEGAVLDRLAADMYGASAVKAVRKAWTAFSTGFEQYPFCVPTIYDGPVQCGPSNPLFAKPSGWSATMVCYPYDDLNTWKGQYPADIWASQMNMVAEGFAEGCRLFEDVVAKCAPEKRAVAERELAMYRAEQLHFRSSVDQARFVIARALGDKATMRSCADRELDAAKTLLPLCAADSRIGYESSNHYFYIPQDLREKIVSTRMILDSLGGRLQK